MQLKELPLLNRKKKELITTACEQLSSTEGAPTVTRSLVSLRSSFDLELTYFRPEERDWENPISCPVLRTWLKREKKTGLKEISLSTIELHALLYPDWNWIWTWILLRAGFHSTFTFHIRNVDLHLQYRISLSGILAPGLAHIHIGHS